MVLEGNVLVTGGAGYLARALYSRAEREGWDCRFTAFSRDDAKHVALSHRFPNVRCIRGDVTGDRDALRAAMAGHGTVIHAAAVKYVDLSETNVLDTVKVNVDGSRNVMYAAALAGIDRVIGISTDKACEPANTYGITKALMERMFVEASRWDCNTSYVICRYGNVVGSTGSVVPKFREQLSRLGHIEVTDLSMTRYWMSADQAVDTIVYAATVPSMNGQMVVPTIKAADLATLVEAAVNEDGRYDMETPMKVIGHRPGEKRHEQLISEREGHRVDLCPHPAYFGAFPCVVITPPGFVPSPVDERGVARPSPLADEYSESSSNPHAGRWTVAGLREVIRASSDI